MQKLFALCLLAALLVTGGATAQEKEVPSTFAKDMYRSAVAPFSASFGTKQLDESIGALKHLVRADGSLADAHNALAVALYLSGSTEQNDPLEHAKMAEKLTDPDVPPQFVVTRILVDRQQWKAGNNGVTRLTREAAQMLRGTVGPLLAIQGGDKKHAQELGTILQTIYADGDDPDYPFVFRDHNNLIENPRPLVRHPSEIDFKKAQKAIGQEIIALRKKKGGGNNPAKE